jgi:hypothetical protein
MQRLPLASEFIARKFVRLLLRFADPTEMRCCWEVVVYSPTSMTTDDDDNGEDDDLCADRDRAWAEQSHVGGARIHTTTLSW